MITILFDDVQFKKDMANILNYSEGFLEGAQKAKPVLLKKLAVDSIEIFKEFVDQQARIDPQMYHHIYEWYQEGSPEARLFDIDYRMSNGGLSLNGKFKQSISVKNGSNTPFYNKAEIMENGIPVTIKPKDAEALSFNVGSEEVFVAGPITVENPGGTRVQHSFEHIFKLFFEQHFSQAVLYATGIASNLSYPKQYKNNFRLAKSNGKAIGIETGYDWIANAGGINVQNINI